MAHVRCGILGTTGVGGLTLGGGIGHLARKHGLTIDNLLGADVVLADGSKVTRQRRREPGPVLGAPRRRRQLRRRHRVPLPAAPGEHGHRRPDLLVARRHRRGHAGLPGVHPECAARAERLLRVRDRAARGAVPRGASRPQGERRRVVLRGRRQRRRPGGDGADAGGGRAAHARGRPAAVRRAPGVLRPVLPEGHAGLLAGGLRPRAARRRDRRPRRARRADDARRLDDAHVPDRRGRPRRRRVRHRVELPRRPVGRGHLRRRPRPGQRRRDRASGRSTTSTRPTRTRRPAGRTSTS